MTMTSTTPVNATPGVGGIGYGLQMTRTEYFKSVLQGSHSKAAELVEEGKLKETFGKIDRQISDKARDASDTLRQLSGENTKITGVALGKSGSTTAFAQFGPAAMGIRA